MFGWIFAFVYLLICLAVQRWWDHHFPRAYRYDAVRKWRTSRVWLFMKAWFIIAIPMYPVIVMLGGTLFNWLTGTFFGVLALTIFGSVTLRLILPWWFEDNPAYQLLLKDGWDPFWDTWWSGLVNRDPDEVKAGQPPLCINATNFTPPSDWSDRCPNCGATQPGSWFWCWNCKLGYEDGCQKMCCPTCDMTFKEMSPGAGRTQAITCPGCGTPWFMGETH